MTLQRAHRAPDTCTLATLSHPLSPWRPGSILGLWPCAQPVVARNTAWPVDREERDVRGTVVRQRLWAEVVLAGIVVLAVVTALVPNWLERLGGEGGARGGVAPHRSAADRGHRDAGVGLRRPAGLRSDKAVVKLAAGAARA